MINPLQSYLNVFRATQVSFAAQSNNAVSSTTVPMVQGAAVSCPVCKGDCGDYSDVKNHYPRYDIAPKECLAEVPKELKGFKTRNIEMFLKPEVLAKFKEMSEAYKKKHNNQPLLLRAGYRDKKGQELMRRKHPGLAAPVGYTEHHTGCALDIDGAIVGTEKYNWLMAHAEEYGFELSYPPNNAQEVPFESWHWRFNEDLLKKKG